MALGTDKAFDLDPGLTDTHRDRDRVAVAGTAVTATVTIWRGSRLAGELSLEVDSVGVRADIDGAREHFHKRSTELYGAAQASVLPQRMAKFGLLSRSCGIDFRSDPSSCKMVQRSVIA